jgi:hypothetical protein
MMQTSLNAAPAAASSKAGKPLNPSPACHMQIGSYPSPHQSTCRLFCPQIIDSLVATSLGKCQYLCSMEAWQQTSSSYVSSSYQQMQRPLLLFLLQLLLPLQVP